MLVNQTPAKLMVLLSFCFLLWLVCNITQRNTFMKIGDIQMYGMESSIKQPKSFVFCENWWFLVIFQQQRPIDSWIDNYIILFLMYSFDLYTNTGVFRQFSCQNRMTSLFLPTICLIHLQENILWPIIQWPGDLQRLPSAWTVIRGKDRKRCGIIEVKDFLREKCSQHDVLWCAAD